MRLWLLCETRELYGDDSVSSKKNCHLPTRKTIKAISNIIQNIGYKVVVTDGINEAISIIKEKQIDIAFPISSSSGGNGRQVWMQSLLEALNIPFVGSDARSILLSSDKYQTNLIASENAIASIPSRTIINSNGEIVSSICENKFPCIVKPNFESDSKGVYLVHSADELREKAELDWQIFNQKIICQPFISGQEITVSVYEENNNPKIFGMAETLTSDEKSLEIYTHEYKHLAKCIKKKPIIPDNIYCMLCENSKRLFKILSLHDYARIDYRLDGNNIPYLLEVTPTPSLPLSASYIRAGELYGIEASTMIQRIINSTIFRYGL